MAVIGWYVLYRDERGLSVRATDGFDAAIGTAWQLHRDGRDVLQVGPAGQAARRRGDWRERDQTELCADGASKPPSHSRMMSPPSVRTIEARVSPHPAPAE
jgi:hypothetical protein